MTKICEVTKVTGAYAGLVLSEEDRREAERAFGEFDRSASLVILPGRRLDDGRGAYENGLIDLVKDL